MDGIELLVFIIARGRGDELIRLAAEEGVAFNVMLRGRGTAGSEMLHILGIGDSEKDVVLLSAEVSRAEGVMSRLAEKARLDRPGGGIAFMLPFSAAASQFMTCALFAGTDGRQQEERKSVFGSKRKSRGGSK